MTESEWLACGDPKTMLTHLGETATISNRKFRLFGCACCRRIWHAFTDDAAAAAIIELRERTESGLSSDAGISSGTQRRL